MFHRDAMTTAAGKHRHTARGRKGRARAFLLAMALGASLLAAACGGGGGGGGGSSDPPPPATLVSITVTPDNLSVFYNQPDLSGAAWAFVATGNFSDGSKRSLADPVTWETDNALVVSIDAMGRAQAENLGTANITATFTTAEGDLVGAAAASVVDACDTTGNSTTQTVGGLSDFSTSTIALTPFSVDIPASVAMGIVLQAGPAITDLIFIDHLGLITTPGGNITGPSGFSVPLSFNQIDSNGDGNETNSIDGLFNFQAEALFFPNGGSMVNLPAGTYTFPVGSTADGINFSSRSLTPTVYYKTPSLKKPVMSVNLFVINGVGGNNFADETETRNDAVIGGAITALENVYKSQVCLTLDVNVQLINDPNFLIIESLPRQFDLLDGSPYPGGTLDALNLFIVGQLAYLDMPPLVNVLGVSAGLPGPFNIQGTVVSGTLAEYIDDSGSASPGAALGFILAHEFGHFLGLFHTSQTNSFQNRIIGHDPIADTPECTSGDLNAGLDSCPDRSNFMFPIIDNNASPPITAGQAIVIKLNPAVSALP